jgi:hypothetical protein
VSEAWGEQPAPEEARHELPDEIDEPTGERIADGHELDEPTAEREADIASDEAAGDAPDEAPPDEDLVEGVGPVATAVARLDSLADLPPADHVEIYEDVHRVLQDALADAAHDSGGDGSGEDRTGSP